MYSKYRIRYFTNSLKTGDITHIHKQCVPGLSSGGLKWVQPYSCFAFQQPAIFMFCFSTTPEFNGWRLLLAYRSISTYHIYFVGATFYWTQVICSLSEHTYDPTRCMYSQCMLRMQLNDLWTSLKLVPWKECLPWLDPSPASETLSSWITLVEVGSIVPWCM